MSDFPSTGYAYDDPFAQSAHNNKKVTGKELAQIQAAMLFGYRYAQRAMANVPGVQNGSLNGLPANPLPANYVIKTLLADANDLAVMNDKTSVLRLSANGAGRLLTGLRGGTHGRIVTIFNSGSLFITLKHENTNSLALNRFSLGATDISMWTGDSVQLMYDGISGRWRCIARYISIPTFRAHRNGTNQTSPNDAGAGAYKIIQFTTEAYDSHGWFDNATNYRYQPLLPGKYFFTGSVSLLSFASGKLIVPNLFKNSATSLDGSFTYSGASGTMTAQGQWVVEMNGSSDYVELRVFNGDASARDINGTEAGTNFGGNYIGS